MTLPNKNGHFGVYGGRFVPDTLFPPLAELEQVYNEVAQQKAFKKELKDYYQHYVGRPTPLFFAKNLAKETGLQIYLKREDLNHTGAHKINNTLGQILLALRMKKKRIIAETGAGQHGVATATVCALMGLKCVVYMGSLDMARQAPNVYRMHLLGAEVRAVESGTKTLKDAASAAMRDWLENSADSHYLIGSVFGPHPYPKIVRDFQSIIGLEVKKQVLKQAGRLPDYLVACVGGGSNAMGLFYPFFKNKQVKMIAVEAGGHGVASGEHSLSLGQGRPGILHGALSYVLQDQFGQINLTHSISAGLDYPGVGPELSHWKDQGRIQVAAVLDQEALQACQWLARNEGIIPALESAHALAILKHKKLFSKEALVVVNLSGRGDKDLATLMENEHVK